MSNNSKTHDILKSKVQNAPNEGAGCLPCKARNNAIWKVYVFQSEILVEPEVKFKHINDALQQYANFTAPQVQSILTSISLLPNDEQLIYSGNEQTAILIHNALVVVGMNPKIDASPKNF